MFNKLKQVDTWTINLYIWNAQQMFETIKSETTCYIFCAKEV